MKSGQLITVEEAYEIDEDELHIRADDSDYWRKAEKFYLENKHRPAIRLTVDQKIWIEKIEDQLLGEDRYDD